jgi:hypothetical protein
LIDRQSENFLAPETVFLVQLFPAQSREVTPHRDAQAVERLISATDFGSLLAVSVAKTSSASLSIAWTTSAICSASRVAFASATLACCGPIAFTKALPAPAIAALDETRRQVVTPAVAAGQLLRFRVTPHLFA